LRGRGPRRRPAGGAGGAPRDRQHVRQRRLAAPGGNERGAVPQRERAALPPEHRRADRVPVRVRRVRHGGPGQGRLRSCGGAAAQARAARPAALRPARERGEMMMEKILADHRRRMGDFEIVEIDEDRIARLRGQLDIDAPVDLHWTWTYGSEVEELRALYERGKKGQWNAETDVDWSAPFPKNEWFLPKEGLQLLPTVLAMGGADDATCRQAAFDEFAWTLSQLLHGEQAALQLCGQLTNACPRM